MAHLSLLAGKLRNQWIESRNKHVFTKDGKGQVSPMIFLLKVPSLLKGAPFRVEGTNRFKCHLARHPFCISTPFEKLSLLLLVVTRIT